MELNLNKLQSTVLVSECFVRKTTSYAGNLDGECKIVLISSSKGNEKIMQIQKENRDALCRNSSSKLTK